MSRFYGSIKGFGKTEATRRGFAIIKGHVRGWDVGIEVVGSVGPDGKDRFQVYRTGGSNDPNRRELIAEVRDESLAATG